MTSSQTIMHSHIHLIPRRKDDVVNPRSGVRGVLPLEEEFRYREDGPSARAMPLAEVACLAHNLKIIGSQPVCYTFSHVQTHL